MTSDLFRALLRQRLDANSDRVLLRILVAGSENSFVELTGATLLTKSVELALKYCQCSPAEVVLLLLPHSVELFLLHLGLVLIGRFPAILPWPTNRIDPEKYQRNILHQLRNLPAAQLLTLPNLARNVDSGVPFVVTECLISQGEKFEALFSVKLNVPLVEKRSLPQVENNVSQEALFLQFSGGTTGEQKCVVVTAPMLIDQLDRLSKRLEITSEDAVVSWLPLYHDMGLIACFWLPLWNVAPSIQFAASDWLMNPGKLFNLIDKYKATLCWLPNFAFVYLAAQKTRVNSDLNLSHVRAWINCSEPVRERAFRVFTEAFSNLGVRPQQCQASYAMAENVFAVTQTPLNKVPSALSRLSVQGVSPDEGQTSDNIVDDRYISSGRALDDMLVRIKNARGELCEDSVAGEIEISGPSLFSGYWNNSGFQSQSVVANAWYATGDYGFMHRGDLYVIGRIKDIIITAGVNIFPEDIEALIHMVEGIYPGRAVAFGIDEQGQGTQSIAVVAEMRGEFDGSMALAIENQIRELISSSVGITIRYVRVIPERWIIKSTAGKISRRETRLKFLRELSFPVAQNLDRKDP